MKCPTCKKPVPSEATKYLPFCSERCQWVDLGRWLAEDYAIPEKEPEPEPEP
jgi:endogenous inhibitor of DNA gyrase (YacG/DUF329 family)